MAELSIGMGACRADVSIGAIAEAEASIGGAAAAPESPELGALKSSNREDPPPLESA